MVNLAPPETFKQRADFLRLAARGRKFARPGLVLQAVKTGTAAPLRVGYTATKKLGNAVARNRARRRLKEAVRLTLAETGPLHGVELVFICRKETASLTFSALRASLKSALTDALK